MAVSRTSADHAAHDELILAVLASGDDLPAEDLARAQAQLRECAECALVVADLRAIQAATADLPAPPRRRDFRLTEEDAARLRVHGWRRLVAAFGSPRDRITGPAAAGLATIGVAGLLFLGVTNGPSQATSTVGSPIQPPANADTSTVAGGAAVPEAAGAGSPAADQMTTMAQPDASAGLKIAPALPASPPPATNAVPIAGSELAGTPPPAATAKPAASAGASASPPPAATAEPIARATPSATPTPTPTPTATPAAEGGPSATPQPAATAGTAAPVTLAEPVDGGGSAAPSTPAPTATPQPPATAGPAATEAPAVTAGPAATAPPAATAVPAAGGPSAVPSRPTPSAAAPTSTQPVGAGGGSGTPLPAETVGPMAVTVPETAGPAESGVAAPDVAQVAPVASELPSPVGTRASTVPEGGTSPQSLAGVLSLLALLAGLALLGLRIAGRRIASRDQAR